MKKAFYLLCSGILLSAASGCSYWDMTQKAVCDVVDEVMLEEPSSPMIQEIVEKHQAQVNRPEELDLLCGKAWVPVYIKGQEGVDGKNAIALPPEVKAYLEFHRDGRISGFAGVNAFDGAFAVTAPNQLRFGAFASTLQAGPHLDYEMLFMAQIKDVDRFEILPSGEIEFKKRNMLMMRCKPEALTAVRKQAKSEVVTPVPPEPKSGIAPKGKADGTVNPALPTVEKAK